jgi:hypothetical protein
MGLVLQDLFLSGKLSLCGLYLPKKKPRWAVGPFTTWSKQIEGSESY